MVHDVGRQQGSGTGQQGWGSASKLGAAGLADDDNCDLEQLGAAERGRRRRVLPERCHSAHPPASAPWAPLPCLPWAPGPACAASSSTRAARPETLQSGGGRRRVGGGGGGGARQQPARRMLTPNAWFDAWVRSLDDTAIPCGWAGRAEHSLASVAAPGAADALIGASVTRLALCAATGRAGHHLNGRATACPTLNPDMAAIELLEEMLTGR